MGSSALRPSLPPRLFFQLSASNTRLGLYSTFTFLSLPLMLATHHTRTAFGGAHQQTGSGSSFSLLQVYITTQTLPVDSAKSNVPLVTL